MSKRSIVPEGLESNYTGWHFSPALESNGFLFLSGCTGTRPDGSLSDDPAEQARDAFRKIELSLRAAGCDFSHVVEMTTYHVGLQAQLEAFKAVKDEFIPEPYPAWTAIGVSEFAVPGAVIEIRIIASAAD